MGNNEIVDGVDVSGCYLYSKDREKYCGSHVPCEGESCWYKLEWVKEQCQQKTIECDHWKHQAELGSDTTDRLSKQLELKEKECEKLKEELDKKIQLNNKLDYIVHNYRICYEGALGALQYLSKEDLTNVKITRYYTNVALTYLSYNSDAAIQVPNKYKQALNDIKEYIYDKKCQNCEKDRGRCIGCEMPKDILDIINETLNFTNNR